MVHEIFKKITSSTETSLHSWIFGEGDPHYFIIAGLHGDEPTSIQVAMELVSILEDQEISGTVEIIPLANRLAFLSKSRTSLDNKDLNRNFPGKSTGTITERLAYQIWTRAKMADYVLDLHCCGQYSSPYILSTYKEHDHSKEFAKTFGVEVCVQSSGIDKPQLFVEASKNDIPAVIIEMPGGGSHGWKPIKYVNKITNAVLSSLVRLDMIDYDVDLDTVPKFAGELQPIVAPKAGIFSPVANPGEELKPSDIVGLIDDNTEIILSQEARLIFTSPHKFVLQGEQIGHYVTYE